MNAFIKIVKPLWEKLRAKGRALRARFSAMTSSGVPRQEARRTLHERMERLNLLLALSLLVVSLLAWRSAPGVLASIDQLRNDLAEQAQVVAMEQQNRQFLEKIQDEKNTLVNHLNTVYAAIPLANERAEEIISMLEDMALRSGLAIDSIGIRLLPETQFYYHDLAAMVGAYQYSFASESSLPSLLAFLDRLRSSLRLMDLMTLDIEETRGGLFKASFVVHAYHLLSDI